MASSSHSSTIPLDNKNAEYTIKTFAELQDMIVKSSTTKEVEMYLTLLSLYQSYKYQEIDFFDFLCFSEKDI